MAAAWSSRPAQRRGAGAAGRRFARRSTPRGATACDPAAAGAARTQSSRRSGLAGPPEVGTAAMRFDIVTIFPAMVERRCWRTGSWGGPSSAGLIDVRCSDLRDFTTDRHRVVDDVPFGGGPGMVLKPEPLFRAVDAIAARARAAPPAVVLTSPQGERLTHAEARRLSRLSASWSSCAAATKAWTSACASAGDRGAVDWRLRADRRRTAGAGVVDAVARLVPGWWATSSRWPRTRSCRGLLDYPQYTRPAVVPGRALTAGAGRAPVGQPRRDSRGGGGGSGRSARWRAGRTC